VNSKTTLLSLCSTREYDFLECGTNCSATICYELVPDYIPKSQILQFIRVLLAREDYYLKGKS
jgi:hypothetical protein